MIIFLKQINPLFFCLSLFFYVEYTKAFQQNDDYEILDIGVRLSGNKRDHLIADLIAKERDIINAGHIDGIEMYHFYIRRKRDHRSKRAVEDLVEDLRRDERIEYVMIGEELNRQKREFLDEEEILKLLKKYSATYEEYRLKDVNKKDSLRFQMTFNDVLYQKQWYLENVGQLDTPKEYDINITPVWNAGYTGKGVLICIVDDGLDHPHPELADHYFANCSYDLNDPDDPLHDPLPRTYDNENNHGTRCAGAATGKANNGMCGVGTAFNANIAGIRVLDGRVTTLLEARALTLFAAETHIKSASWGPSDDGTKMEAPGHLVNAALDFAVTHGRQGKGTILVWASGNGGIADDDCGADGYVSHHNVMSIGSVNHLGETTSFDEFCPSTMATVYTGGKHSNSVNEKYIPIGVVAADVGGKCTTSFFGTSGAAPVAAGAFALVLEANPDLSYRDLMHIVARTARIPTLSEIEGWMINGAGYHVNDRFGFGVLDVGQMVALAQNWTNVEPRYTCYHEYKDGKVELSVGGLTEISIDVEICENITQLEHVVANISYSFHRRGDVKITVISPSGTPSEMLSFRKNDADEYGIEYFPFLSNHHWDEAPTGRWILRMETREPQNLESLAAARKYNNKREIGYFGLRLYGSHNPNEKTSKRERNMAFAPTQQEIESIYKREMSQRESPNVMQKRTYENLVRERKAHAREETKSEDNRSFFGFFRRIFNF